MNFSWRYLVIMYLNKVLFCVIGYRAVICGMDPVCCESKSWIEAAKVDKLARGPDQPFYQVLPDSVLIFHFLK